jgi:HEAT repeat protein
MTSRGRTLTYVIIAVVGLGLIGWLTARYLVKRQLLQNLSSNDMKVRVAAARSLMEMRKLEDALPAQAIIVRSKTAQALGEIGTDEAIRLLGVILKDQEEAPRRWAREALVKQGEHAVATLMAALSATGGTLDEAVKGLQDIGLVGAPEVRMLLSDRSSYKGASQALSKMGSVGVGALLAACYVVDEDLRTQVLKDLGKQKVMLAEQPALDNLKPKMSPGAGLGCLGELGDPRTTLAVIPFLKKTDNREDAANALGLIGDARGLEPIMATMTITEKNYRETAIVALRRIVHKSGPVTYPAMARYLQSPQVLVRRAAAAGLVGADSALLNGALAAALRDADEQVRASAASAMGWPGNLGGVPTLVAALSDSQWRVVSASVGALSAIGPGVIPELLGAIAGSGNTTVNYQIAEGVVGMGTLAVPQLISALSSPNSEVQKWSAVALGEIRDRRAVQPLEKLEKTATGDLKWVVQEQLRVLAGPAGS